MKGNKRTQITKHHSATIITIMHQQIFQLLSSTIKNASLYHHGYKHPSQLLLSFPLPSSITLLLYQNHFINYNSYISIASIINCWYNLLAPIVIIIIYHHQPFHSTVITSSLLPWLMSLPLLTSPLSSINCNCNHCVIIVIAMNWIQVNQNGLQCLHCSPYFLSSRNAIYT